MEELLLTEIRTVVGGVALRMTIRKLILGLISV